MRRNMYSSAVFAAGEPLCDQILPGQGRPPSTILGARKQETLGYPTAKTASVCVPSFDTVSECDGQTDGRSIHSACKASVARQKPVKPLRRCTRRAYQRQFLSLCLFSKQTFNLDKQFTTFINWQYARRCLQSSWCLQVDSHHLAYTRRRVSVLIYELSSINEELGW